MRLLSFEDNELVLTEYVTDVPPYAILSHTWGHDRDEVSFENLSKGTGREKSGYDKIRFCHWRATSSNLKYFWIDTCCIDKASSSELSEAINSMFKWYRNAAQCYVYMSDVSSKRLEDDPDDQQSRNRWKSSFRRSRWFTRGWTLQELLAPSSVEFFSVEGERLGCKRSLEQQIHGITGIPLAALQGRPLVQFGVDERLRWAEKRQTKREEDAAYSLLGIFEVHMPLIYGEGRENALNRLSREVNESPYKGTMPLRQLSGNVDAHRLGTDTQATRIRQWLSAPDPSTNHQKALGQRQANTGTWFLNSKKFAEWKSKASLLWLHGIAGCGKTVLASSIIENVLPYASSTQSVVLYFYFDFSDSQKQTAEQLLRSLVLQSWKVLGKATATMEKFTSERPSDATKPHIELNILLKTFGEFVSKFAQIYLVVDALDECISRTDLLSVIEQLAHRRGVHAIFTSRREWWIQSAMERLIQSDKILAIQSELVDEDIRAYVQYRLVSDDKLGKWRSNIEIQQRIQDEIMRGAVGMFRWAVCQLDALQRCRNERMLDKALATLPPTLDETYSRILSTIADDDSQYAIRILRWLTFSARSLTATEISHVIAIDPERRPGFDPKEVLQDPLEALDICSSLITIAGPDESGFNDAPIILLAHYTVKEYLVSSRILEGSVPQFAMNAALGHSFIAKSCLLYIIHFDQFQGLTKAAIDQFPLARYAAQHWITHERAFPEQDEETTSLIVQFFTAFPGALNTWLRIHNIDEPFHGSQVLTNNSMFPSPLYYAARVGLTEVVRRLVTNEGVTVNNHEGWFGSALQAASVRGDFEIVQLLLDAGADLTTTGGRYGSPLNAAAVFGHLQVAKLLLEKGINLYARGGGYSNALHAASCNGNEQIVELLVEHISDTVQTPEVDVNALHGAAFQGHTFIVKRLLDRGVPINAQGVDFDSALLAALAADHDEIEPVMQLLIERGADVNAEGGPFGHPIQAAASRCHEAAICLLLDNGASLRTFTGYFGSVVNAIAFRGNTRLLQNLSAREDFDIHMVDHHGRSALHMAALNGQLETFTYLLRQKLDPFARDAKGDDLLSFASLGGSLSVLQSAFDIGLSFSSQENRWTPLHWACRMGHTDIIEQLVMSGAFSTSVTTLSPPAVWDPLSIGYFHGQSDALAKLSAHTKQVLTTKFQRSNNSNLAKVKERNDTAICDGCCQGIYGPWFNCLDCGDFDYCFMCKPFLEHLHTDHRWNRVK